ncbi:hypothetical protein Tco_0398701, partial [Tanacetum coccineum]
KVDKTPYEIWHGQAPKLSYLRVWGCEVFVKHDTLTKPEEDTNPSVDTSLNHEEDDQEIDEPQSDINPIRDLGEPANYEAALLDPESDKWLNAINVKMQSIRDNEV